MQTFKLKYYLNALKKDNLIIKTNKIENILEKEVLNICYNSKEVVKDTLYVCKGINYKKEYLEEAIANGAFVYLAEKENITKEDFPYVLVGDVRKALGLLSQLYFDNPTSKINMIGITGTKGKSTTAYYIKSILDYEATIRGEKENAILSSIDDYDGITLKEALITTPESLEINHKVYNALSKGIKNFIMEVSSQALKLDRVYPILYKVGVFMNISQDHISNIEHPDFDDYLHCKLKLFNQVETACVNLDSDYASVILESAKKCKKVITFSTKNREADIFGYNIKKVNHQTISFKVRTKEFDKKIILSMPGLFNVENALAAISIASALNVSYSSIYEGLKIAKVSGRMETHETKDGSIIAIVDYAHNKLSFERLYESTKNEYPDKDIITVFGCPGGKALLRRKDLGLLSGINSKMTYLTAEDPGLEEVHDISLEIAKYVSENGKYKIIDDREEAIKTAILDNPNSVILITGKGNETRQKYGKEYLPCKTDTQCVLEAFKEYEEKQLIAQ